MHGGAHVSNSASMALFPDTLVGHKHLILAPFARDAFA
jgi:hypothetical protein